MNKTVMWLIGLALAILAGFYFWMGNSNTDVNDQPLYAKVIRSDFKIDVKATGELKAKNSVKIKGPSSMRDAGVNRTSITRILPEGTVVKEGDWVASLDKSSLQTKLNDIDTELEKIESQLLQAKIDTALELSNIRDQMIDLDFTKKEKKLYVEQSKYEPQMIIRQAELDLERVERDHKKLKKQYRLKKQQARARVFEFVTTRKQQFNKRNKINDVMEDFDIKAPEAGMLIYQTGWSGEKRGVGSEISPWNSEIAELPDLTSMISKTYVNEVDVSKVREGQHVNITIDAFPDKKYSGIITSVANMGQKLRGQDSKVFEVVVSLNSTDSILRPAMTTANEISSRSYINELIIPLEALRNDSLTCVIIKGTNGAYLQEIYIAATNDDHALVRLGLQENDEMYLFYSDPIEELEIKTLTAEEKIKIKNSILEENKLYNSELAAKAKKFKKRPKFSRKGGGGMRFIIN